MARTSHGIEALVYIVGAPPSRPGSRVAVLRPSRTYVEPEYPPLAKMPLCPVYSTTLPRGIGNLPGNTSSTSSNPGSNNLSPHTSRTR